MELTGFERGARSDRSEARLEADGADGRSGVDRHSGRSGVDRHSWKRPAWTGTLETSSVDRHSCGRPVVNVQRGQALLNVQRGQALLRQAGRTGFMRGVLGIASSRRTRLCWKTPRRRRSSEDGRWQEGRSSRRSIRRWRPTPPTAAHDDRLQRGFQTEPRSAEGTNLPQHPTKLASSEWLSKRSCGDLLLLEPRRQGCRGAGSARFRMPQGCSGARDGVEVTSDAISSLSRGVLVLPQPGSPISPHPSVRAVPRARSKERSGTEIPRDVHHKHHVGESHGVDRGA
jgi:hypothetical protein